MWVIFYRRKGGEIGKSGETARTCESSFVRAINRFREIVGIEQRSHHSIYTIYTPFESARCAMFYNNRGLTFPSVVQPVQFKPTPGGAIEG